MMNPTPPEAPTLVTLTPGPTRADLIAEAHRRANEARTDSEVTRAKDDITFLGRPGAGLCSTHQNRTDIDTFFGVDQTLACCTQGLENGVTEGRLIVMNPSVLDDIANDERRERLDRLHARHLHGVVRERVNEVADRLCGDLQTIAAGGGEPARRLADALRALLAEGEEQTRLRIVGSLGA